MTEQAFIWVIKVLHDNENPLLLEGYEYAVNIGVFFDRMTEFLLFYMASLFILSSNIQNTFSSLGN